MSVLVGNSKKAAAYPVGRGLEIAKQKKREENYLHYLSKQLLENYSTFMAAAKQ